jgi:hypothetical protein
MKIKRTSVASQIAKFWETTMPIPFSGCFIWMGKVTTRGYGVIGSGFRAHRVAWELTNGAIPDGLLVCHRCDVPLCVNPSHLFLGTPADNVRDMIRKGRQIFQGRPRVGSVIPGQRCGSWLVTDQVEHRNTRMFRACICDCGTERFVYDHDLWSGKSKGCGHAYAYLHRP